MAEIPALDLAPVRRRRALESAGVIFLEGNGAVKQAAAARMTNQAIAKSLGSVKWAKGGDLYLEIWYLMYLEQVTG